MAGTIYGIRRGVGGAFGTTSDSITVTLLVEMDSATAGPIEVVNVPGVPAQGSFYSSLFPNESNYSLILNSATTRQDSKGPKFWEIELNYESIPSNSSSNGNNTPGVDPSNPEHRDNPLARPVEATQSFRLEQRVADKCFDSSSGGISGLLTPLAADDIDDASARTYKAVVNSAKERFTDPPLMEDYEIQTWSIVKNISLADKIAIEAGGYACSLNSDVFTLDGVIFQIAEGRLLPIIFRRIRERNILYYQATFTLERNPETWIRSVLDRGPRDKNGASPTGSDFINGSAWNLDGSGLFKTANSDPSFMYFRTKRYKSFSSLLYYWT